MGRRRSALCGAGFQLDDDVVELVVEPCPLVRCLLETSDEAVEAVDDSVDFGDDGRLLLGGQRRWRLRRGRLDADTLFDDGETFAEVVQVGHDGFDHRVHLLGVDVERVDDVAEGGRRRWRWLRLGCRGLRACRMPRAAGRRRTVAGAWRA